MGETKKAGETLAESYLDAYTKANDISINPQRLPVVSYINVGTGLGKTKGIVIFALEMLKKHKNLVIVQVENQREQLKIDKEDEKRFSELGIPFVRIFADAELYDPLSRFNIFELVKEINNSNRKKFDEDFIEKVRKILARKENKIKVQIKVIGGNRESELNDDEYEEIQSQVTSNENDALEDDDSKYFDVVEEDKNVIRVKVDPSLVLGSIMQDLSWLYKNYEFKDQNEVYNKSYQKILADLLSKIKTIISILYKSGIGEELNKIDEYKETYRIYREIIKRVFGWFIVQEKGYGFVMMTTKKLLTYQSIIKVSKSKNSRFTLSSAHMSNIVHNTLGKNGSVYNLDKSAFLFFIDESDQSKSDIEETLYYQVLKNHNNVVQLIFSVFSILFNKGDIFNKNFDCKKYFNSKLVCEELNVLMDKINKELDYMEEFYAKEGIDIKKERIISLAKKIVEDNIVTLIISTDSISELMRRDLISLFSTDLLSFANYKAMDGLYIKVNEEKQRLEITTKAKDSQYSLLEFASVVMFIVRIISYFKRFTVKESRSAIEEKQSEGKDISPNDLHHLRINLLSDTSISNGPAEPVFRLFREKRTLVVNNLDLYRNTWSSRDRINKDVVFRDPKFFFSLYEIPRQSDQDYVVDATEGIPVGVDISHFIWTPEFEIERMISKQAFHYNEDIYDDEDNDNKGNKSSDNYNDEKDLVNGVFFLSATGGFEDDVANDFSKKYFKMSEFVKVIDIDKSYIDKISELRDLRVQNKAGSKVYVIDDLNVGSQLITILDELLNSLDHEKLSEEDSVWKDFNYHKEQEIRLILSLLSVFWGLNIKHDKNDIYLLSIIEDLRKAKSMMMISQTSRFLRQFFTDANGIIETEVKDSLYSLKSSNIPSYIITFDTNAENRLRANYVLDKLTRDLGITVDKNKSVLDALLTFNGDAKISFYTPWKSGSRAFNFTTYFEGNKEDFDILALINEQYYSKTQVKDEDNNILDKLKIYHYYSQYIVLTTNKESLPLVREFYDFSLTRYNNVSLTLFRNNQNIYSQTFAIMQAIGRIERTDAKKPAIVIMSNEVFEKYRRGTNLLLRNNENRVKLLSALNKKVYEYVLEREKEYTYTLDPSYIEMQEDIVKEFHREKGKLLRGIEELKENESISIERAKSIINAWNSFRSETIFTDFEGYKRQLREYGVNTDIVDKMLIEEPPNNKSFLVKKVSEDYFSDYLLTNEIDEQTFFYAYSYKRISKYVKWLFNNASSGVQDGLRIKKSDGKWYIPHPAFLLSDLAGIVGELVAKRWFKSVYHKTPIKIDETNRKFFKLYELFDLYYPFEDVLVGVDAKNWSYVSDSELSKETFVKLSSKVETVNTVLSDIGYRHFVAVLFSANLSYGEVKMRGENIVVMRGYRELKDSIRKIPLSEKLLSEVIDSIRENTTTEVDNAFTGLET